MRPAVNDIETPESVKAERDRLLEIVASLGAVSASAGSTPKLMNETVCQIMKLTRADGAVVELVDGDELEYHAASGTVANYVGLRLKAATSLSGLSVARQQAIYSHDTETDDRVDGAACRKISARSMLVVPLICGAEAIGVLKAVSRMPASFDRIDEHALSLFAQFIGGVIARQAENDRSQALAADMTRRALRDELTQLPTRSAWLEELDRGIERARRAKAPLAVMYMDLDGFKAVNDRYGHAAGDYVLAAFAAQVRGCVRRSDFVARLSGDEFVVMLEGFDDVERDVPVVADKIIEAARSGTPWEGTTLHCLPSIGVAFQNGPEYGAATLMRYADGAMYRAKAGRTLFTVANCTGVVSS